MQLILILIVSYPRTECDCIIWMGVCSWVM